MADVHEAAAGLSADTEVLTPDGWKRGIERRMGDEVAAFDSTRGIYRFERVLGVSRTPYQGPMVHVSGASGSFLLAPGHPVLLRTLPQSAKQRARPNPWRYREAGRLPRNCQLPLLGHLPGPGLPTLSLEFVRVLGWVIASGYFHNKDESRVLAVERSTKGSPRAAALVASMDRSLGKLEGVRRYERPARSAVTYYLGKALSEKLLAALGADIYRIPRQLLKEGSPRQLSTLYRSLLEASGSMRGARWATFYPGRDEVFADQFQELATRLGVATTKTYVKAVRGWVLSLAGRKHYNVKQRRSEVGSISYEGEVWDIVVPSGAVLVRRQGRLVTLGACLNQASRIASLHAERQPRPVRRRKLGSRGSRPPKSRPLEPAVGTETPVFGIGTVKLHAPAEEVDVPSELSVEQVRSWLKGRSEP